MVLTQYCQFPLLELPIKIDDQHLLLSVQLSWHHQCPWVKIGSLYICSILEVLMIAAHQESLVEHCVFAQCC